MLKTFKVTYNNNWDWKKPKVVKDYLLLNNAGREKVLKGEMTERKDWVDAVASCSRNANGLFFFLRQNPSLLVNCNLPDETSKITSTKKRKRRRKN